MLSWDEDSSALKREARRLVGGKSRAAFSWRQDGLEVFFPPVCATFGPGVVPIWKIPSCHDFGSRLPLLSFPMVRIRSLLSVS